jgi:hypothetical protein
VTGAGLTLMCPRAPDVFPATSADGVLWRAMKAAAPQRAAPVALPTACMLRLSVESAPPGMPDFVPPRRRACAHRSYVKRADARCERQQWSHSGSRVLHGEPLGLSAHALVSRWDSGACAVTVPRQGPHTLLASRARQLVCRAALSSPAVGLLQPERCGKLLHAKPRWWGGTLRADSCHFQRLEVHLR